MPTVDRTARVLLAFAGTSPDLGVSEIAAETGLVKSTVHRTLTALVDSGLVARDGRSARYRLGPRATELGMAALGTGDIRHLALPTLLELRDATGETATASLLVGRQRVYVAQVESHASVRMTVEIGARFPLYAGASGRAISRASATPSSTTTSPRSRSTGSPSARWWTPRPSAPPHARRARRATPSAAPSAIPGPRRLRPRCTAAAT